MEITKEMIENELENELGYEINKFELKPLYKENICVGLTIIVEPKIKSKFINNSIVIAKPKEIKEWKN